MTPDVDLPSIACEIFSILTIIKEIGRALFEIGQTVRNSRKKKLKFKIDLCSLF